MTDKTAKEAKKDTEAKAPAKEARDPHARIDKLEELMRANGWTV